MTLIIEFLLNLFFMVSLFVEFVAFLFYLLYSFFLCLVVLYWWVKNARLIFVYDDLGFLVYLLSAEAKSPEPEVSSDTDAFTHFKHLLLPITDRNPYLSEGTKQVTFLFGHLNIMTFYIISSENVSMYLRAIWHLGILYCIFHEHL